MNRLFYKAHRFNADLSRWDVSRVTSMQKMFAGSRTFTSLFNGNIGNWNVSQVSDMRGMFDGCGQFNQPLDRWDVSNVRCMGRMFRDCWEFNQEFGSSGLLGVHGVSTVGRGNAS
jgi:surface protein